MGASSAAAQTLRPGVARGAYPERPDRRAPALERLANAVVGVVSVPRRASRAEVDAFARSVDTEAGGLCDLTEAVFDTRVAELRNDLRLLGICKPMIPRGFAILREAARRSLGTPHYDVQLYGGRVMMESGLAELETGEGKTLTATLPTAFAALAGIPVHVITVNDYLVERDVRSLRALYERLGVSVGCVVEAEQERAARREAYECDVTYVTNKQVAFDYLRDRLAAAGDRSIARELMLESAPSAETDDAPVMRGLCLAIVDEADSVLVDDARTPLILSRAGAPVDEPTVRAALQLSRALAPGKDYAIDKKRGMARITDAGRVRLEQLAGCLEGPLAGARRREEWVERALCAEHVFEKDLHYLVHDGAVQIIDLPTGRRAPDRAFESGVHALIEARSGLPLSPQRETIARISYQRFFRRYLRLGGMTGTASEVAGELFSVYGLRTVTLPTRLPLQREGAPLRVFATDEARWSETISRIRDLHEARRPVLVGTSSVSASVHVSELLDRANLPHRVLSALQDGEEAEVVALAGEAGRITVATRMAGRGTDIPLGSGVSEMGGLAVVATEMSEARRIDRQLFGRCARQGGPGGFEQLVSLDDRLFETHLPSGLLRVAARGLLPDSLLVRLTRIAQKAEERRSALARRRLLESERSIDDLLSFSGSRE